MAKTLRAGAPKMPPAAPAYLDTIAFRCENEPDDLALVVTQKVVHNGRVFSADDIDAGRAFLERWSLPLANLERSHIRALITELVGGRAPATGGRRWTQMRAILRWWADEDLVAKNLTSRLGVIRGTSIPTLGDDEAIPDEREMWMMAWALCLTGKPQFAALPFVMGAAGLRIGECYEFRRRDCTDDPNAGIWHAVRGTLASPGRSWTDSGQGSERRGTKAKGPDGDLRGRRTDLPPAEATVVRTHLATFTKRPADALVFTGTTGKPLDVCHLQERAWETRRSDGLARTPPIAHRRPPRVPPPRRLAARHHHDTERRGDACRQEGRG